VAALLGLLLPAIPAVALPVAAASTQTAVMDNFDVASPTWYVKSGPGTVAQSGNTALALSYNFASAGQIIVAPKLTRPDLPGLPRRVCVDVDGDGSWNVVDMQLRDSTGEIFHYRLGNLSFTGWSTLCVRPGTDAPAATIGGNVDGVVDLPLAIFGLVLDKNPGGKAVTGRVLFDDLRVEYEAWTPLSSAAAVFVPSAGQTTTLRLGLQEAATFVATLTDEAGRTRTWNGTTSGGGAQQSLAWNGTDSAGTAMSGSVRARLKITRSGVSQTVGVPYLAGLPARYEPASPGSIVGINSYVDTINTSERSSAETQVRLMESAYVRQAREEFDWHLIEPRQGWFEWAKFDQAVEIMQAHNIAVLGKLLSPPSWASSAPSGSGSSLLGCYPPSNTADYAAYARAVVHRYKDRVHVWQVWNEENWASAWCPAPNATAYTALLKAAYAAIKAEDPTATVLIGGLAASDRTFLDKIRAAGGWNSFDAVAIHTYVNGAPEVSIAGQWLDEMRAYVDSVGRKPIYITEFSWSTSTGSGVSLAAQAEYLSRFYLMAAKAGIAGVFWFQFQAHSPSASSVDDNYAVVNYDGTTRPAYAALRRVGEALDQGSVLGDADPNAATRQVADKMASTSGWTAMPLGGGSAKISTSTSVGHGDSSSMAVGYSFTSSSTGVELRRNLTLPGKPTSVALWVLGDDSASPVHIKVTDATGETFQARVGSLQPGWQRLVFQFDKASLSGAHSGGDGDGVIDYPVSLTSVFIYRGNLGHLSGTAYLDDVQVESGLSVRGLAVSRRGGVEQILYTLSSPAKQIVPTTEPSWIADGSTTTAVSASGGVVSTSLSGLPVNILSSPALTAPSVLIHANGTRTATAVRWPAGDGGSYTLQILDKNGRLLTTLPRVYVSAGIASASWDGSIGGKAVAVGSYKLIVVLTGVDGRVTKLGKSVTVAAG
jgi:hypothetical protein